MSLKRTKWMAACAFFQLALSAAAAETALPMKIKSCDVRVEKGTVIISLGYASSKPLPEDMLIVVSVKSENGEEMLVLNYQKDQVLTVVPSSGQALFTTSGYYVLVKKGAKGTISMKFQERSWNIYDLAGICAEIHVSVYEDKKGEERKLGETTSKKVRL